jgi:hypothetical protein
MLWPQCLEPSTAVTNSSSGVIGSGSGSNGAPLEAEVPHQITRLTVVSGTAADSAAAAAYSTVAGNTGNSSGGGWVLAGTAQGMLLVYDYSKLRAACSTTQASTTSTSTAAALAAAAAVVPAAELSLHSGPVTALLCAADGTHCFTASADGCVFVCKLRARRGRKPHRYRLTPPNTTNTNNSSSSTITARDAELYDDKHDAKGATTAAAAAAAATVTAAASTTAAALVLMDAGAARRLREQVLEAVATAEQQSQSTRFSLDRQVQCYFNYSVLLLGLVLERVIVMLMLYVSMLV